MNNKEDILYQIVDVVVECCSTRVKGKMSVTTEEVLGPCRKENVQMTRQIVAGQIKAAGYSVTTIAELLGRNARQVRNMLTDYYLNVRSNRAYRIADAEATLKCREITE